MEKKKKKVGSLLDFKTYHVGTVIKIISIGRGTDTQINRSKWIQQITDFSLRWKSKQKKKKKKKEKAI